MKLALVLLAALAVATPVPHPDPEALPDADPKPWDAPIIVPGAPWECKPHLWPPSCHTKCRYGVGHFIGYPTFKCCCPMM
jgi:hypothetical protein